MQLKNLETQNFRVSSVGATYEIKATTPMARAYLRLKKISNPTDFSYRAVSEQETLEALLGYLSDLEAGVAKLAAI